MKIYAINNYDLEWCYKDPKNVPRHQSWGIDAFRNAGHLVHTHTITDHTFFKVIFGRFRTPILNFIFCLFFILSGKGRKYDVVISFFSPTLTFFPFFKKIGLIKASLVTIVHHGGVSPLSLKYMDKVLFLSDEIKNTYPKLVNAETINWAPDLPFYNTYFKFMRNTEDTRLSHPILISTGKTYRDNNLLIQACEDLRQPLKLFGNQKTNDFVEWAPAKGYVNMLERMKACSINIIACNQALNQNLKHLCGLTSILDGLALGMPLIYSDNCNLPFNPEKECFGISYKTGSLDSLKQSILKLTSNKNLMKTMGQKARLFAEKNDYNKYCDFLINSITQNPIA